MSKASHRASRTQICISEYSLPKNQHFCSGFPASPFIFASIEVCSRRQYDNSWSHRTGGMSANCLLKRIPRHHRRSSAQRCFPAPDAVSRSKRSRLYATRFWPSTTMASEHLTSIRPSRSLRYLFKPQFGRRPRSIRVSPAKSFSRTVAEPSS